MISFLSLGMSRAPMSTTRLAPGVARYCDTGLRTQSRGPLYDNYSDKERREIEYQARRPEVQTGRIDIRCGPPAGYDHVTDHTYNKTKQKQPRAALLPRLFIFITNLRCHHAHTSLSI